MPVIARPTEGKHSISRAWTGAAHVNANVGSTRSGVESLPFSVGLQSSRRGASS